MSRPCTLILRIEDYKDKNNEFEWECELDPSDGAGIVSFPDEKFNKDQFRSGVSTLFGDVEIDRKGKARINGNPIFGRRKSKDSGRNGKGRELAVLGNRTVLAIRVVGNDIATTAGAWKISNEIFGTNGDVFNLKTGYTACSFGDLNFDPTPDTRITNGVYTVVLNENIARLSDGQLRDKVVARGNSELGNLPSQFDHVMLCLPPISGFNGIAYAYLNHWLSVYNDDWCNYPSAQLHEIGHNIDLGKEYCKCEVMPWHYNVT